MRPPPNPIQSTKSRRAPLARFLLLGVGLLVIGLWLANTPSGLLGKADAIGYAVCHRIDLRSFQLGERQLPLCVRCSGMYLGALAALGYFALRGRLKANTYPRWPILVVFGVFTLLWVIDGVNSYVHLFPVPMGVYTPSNLLRLITGTLMGVILISLLLPSFNQGLWPARKPERNIQSLPDLLLLVGAALGITSLQLTGNPLILYPLAILSAASVLIILSMVYAMVIGLLIGSETNTTSRHNMVIIIVGGVILAVLQIALIDAGRYWLTGTWEGFHF